MNGQPGDLTPYPVNAEVLAALVQQTRKTQGYPAEAKAAQPTIVAQETLLCWNRYLAEDDEQQRAGFLEGAAWLVARAITCADDGAGWPVVTQLETLPEPVSLLSSTAQGLALSVLVRAYQLTNDEAYWHLAERAVRPFAFDIFDGGVNAPFGSAGLFFQEVAAYPASHNLGACLIALCGLYEYQAIAADAEVAPLLQRCLSTLSTALPVFDTSYWSWAELGSRRLAAPATHALHIALLEELARTSGDGTWATVASRWTAYQRTFSARLRFVLRSTSSRWSQRSWGWVRRRFFATEAASPGGKKRVIVPITAFPVPGGMRSVLAGLAKAMAGEWEIEYLTRQTGPNPDGLKISTFGNSLTSNWHFPTVWLYVFAGWCRLISLLRQHHYHVVLPQDGVFTGAYAALAARMAGVRLVCVEHGVIPQLYNQTYRADRLKELQASPWLARTIKRLLLVCYWPSLRLLARVATPATDTFLVHGDDIELTYRQQLGVSSDRMIRYSFLIDTERYAPCDALTKAQQRATLGVPAESFVVALVNRLAPEKGLDIALQGISGALKHLPVDVAAKVRVVIAGDGPLRAQVEADIHRYHLESTCLLPGVMNPAEVAQLLGISDLFLFTAIRDSNSVAVLEAMAAGLPVIASAVPPSKRVLLGEGRGSVVPPGDVEAVAQALAEAIREPLRGRQMGSRARAYIETHHSAEVIRRSVLRSTGWPLEASAVTQGTSGSQLIAGKQGIA